MLDGGSQIVLANMLAEIRLICTYDQGLAKPLTTSPYHLVDRKILCHCHIQSGLTYVLKNVGSCNSTLQPKISYTVNLAFLAELFTTAMFFNWKGARTKSHEI